MTIKHLVLSGGGYKGFMSIGALKYLSDQNFYNINEIENIYGTSVGSLIGVILCLKLEWNDMVEYAINKPWNNLITFSTEIILNIISKKGILDKKFIDSIFINLFKNVGLNSDSTLLDLYNYSNICINLFSVNINTFELVRFNYKTYPETKILDAVYMSCSIPFIFQPLYFNESLYIDGGVINPYPLNICLDEHKNDEEILALKIVDDSLTASTNESSIFGYGFYLFYKLIKLNYKYKVNKKTKYELMIPSQTMNINDAQEIINSTQMRKKLIDSGIGYARVFLSYL